MNLDDLELSWNEKENLIGKVALVTGASSGIGASIARKLAKRGAYVTVVARRRDRLDELVQELHKEGLYEVMTVPADIQKAEEVQHVVNKTINRWRRLDIIVANAGFGYRSPLVEVDLMGGAVQDECTRSYVDAALRASADAGSGQGRCHHHLLHCRRGSDCRRRSIQRYQIRC